MTNKTDATAEKSFAVFYANRFAVYLSNADLDARKTKIMSLRNFHDNYVYVGTFKGGSVDAIYQLLQDGGGNLGVQCDRETGEPIAETLIHGHLIQELLIAKAGHTSLFSGDIAVDLSTGDISMCASFGWDKIEIDGMREQVAA